MTANRTRTAALGVSAALATALIAGNAAPAFADGTQQTATVAGAASQAATGGERAQANIPIDKEHFPDDNFRAWLLDPENPNLNGAASDGILTPEEIAQIDGLSPRRQGIRNLTGVEYFTNIIYLNAEENYLTSVDLSTLTELRNVYLRNNQIERIDFTHNTKLEFIEIFENRLTSIDVSMLPNLRFLHVDHNRLTELDLSHNTKLEGDGFVVRNNPTIKKLILPKIEGKDGELATWKSTFINEQDAFGYPGEFDGYDNFAWYTDSAHTEELPVGIKPGTEGEIYTYPFAGQTLYGKRIPNPYTVRYNLSGGTGTAPEATPAVWGTSFNLPSADGLSRTGYTFAGWKLPDNTVKAAGESVSNLAGKTLDQAQATVTATWNPITYTVNFSDEKHEGEEPQTITATYDKGFVLPETPAAVKGFIFTGWKLPDGTIAAAGATVDNLADTQGVSVTVEAQWAVDKLADLKSQFKTNLTEAYTTIQKSDDYFEGVKTAAEKIDRDGVAAIEGAQSSAEASTAYQRYSQQLNDLPTIASTCDELADMMDGYEDFPSTFTDLTASDEAAIRQLANEWSGDTAGATALKALVGAQLTTESEPVSITYTDEDRATATEKLKQSPAFAAEKTRAQSIKTAWNLIKRQDELANAPMGSATAEKVDDYQKAISKVRALPDPSLATSHLEALNTRLELARSKQSAQQRVQSEFDSLTQFGGEYSEEARAKLQSILSKALADIDAAENTEEASKLQDTAMDDLSTVPTLAQEEAAKLQAAKDEAEKELRDHFAVDYQQDDYSASSWEKLNDLLESAVTDVQGASSIEEVEDVNALWLSLNAELAEVPTLVDEANAALAQAKQDALDKLDRTYKEVKADKHLYSKGNWAKVEGLYEDAKVAVRTAESPEGAAAAADEAIRAMSAVERDLAPEPEPEPKPEPDTDEHDSDNQNGGNGTDNGNEKPTGDELPATGDASMLATAGSASGGLAALVAGIAARFKRKR